MVRAAPSAALTKDGVGPDSGVDEKFFAEFDRGMRDLPGEFLELDGWIALHRASLVDSIGCSC